MNEGYYALLICILSKAHHTPEQAFDLLEGKKPSKVNLEPGDIENMILLKREKTYEQIGELYGMSADAVYNRIRRHTGRLKSA